MSQIGRNLTDAGDGILSGKRYLIPDRHPLFTGEFLDMLADAGVQSVKPAGGGAVRGFASIGSNGSSNRTSRFTRTVNLYPAAGTLIVGCTFRLRGVIISPVWLISRPTAPAGDLGKSVSSQRFGLYGQSPALIAI